MLHRMLCVALLALVSTVARAEEPALAFNGIAENGFSFDTGMLAGRLQADGYGLVSLVHKPTGMEVAYGGKHQGPLAIYRTYAGVRRFTDPWSRKAEASLLGDGTVRLFWPTDEEHPFELDAVYRISSADTVDLTITVKPNQPLPAFEIFVGSYFASEFPVSVYLAQPRSKTPEASGSMIPVDVSPLTDGTYYMFPRDRQAAHFLLDGRWEVGKNPVHWSLTRYLAAPLAIRRHAESGVTGVLMARPEDCFAIAASYNKTPPDGIANHNSIYLSLFGRDVAAGEPATTRCRLVVGTLNDAEVVERYRAFVK
ncbi:MAG: hypothetical protein ACOY3P_15890 [Planctomycetota bacterium]